MCSSRHPGRVGKLSEAPWWREAAPPGDTGPMPALRLSPPSPADADALLDFELHNRSFFEARINARADAYYTPEGIGAAIAEAQADAAADLSYQYLVHDTATHRLVGRVNLTRVRRAHFHSAELGYRVAESAGGRGIGSVAVRQVLALAFGPLGLRRIEAVVRPENTASVRVLERNGFVPFGRSRRSFELNGTWYDRLYFERHADGEASPSITADTSEAGSAA